MELRSFHAKFNLKVTETLWMKSGQVVIQKKPLQPAGNSRP